MDGFFSGAPLRPVVDPSDESIDRFAQAIAGRFNHPDKPLLIARLSATISDANASQSQHDSKDGSVPASSSTAQAPATHLSCMSNHAVPPRFPSSTSSTASTSFSAALAADFTVVTATSLPELLRTPHLLVLDIRPHSAYSASRLPHAISLSVPSTLLKRPAFTLKKLATMLSSSTARSRFSAWKTANRILVYDADSSSLHDGNNLLGLFRKFHAEGYTGNIAWLQGGIQALWRENRQLLDESSVSDEEEDAETPRFIRARDLPLAAFQQATTMAAHSQAQTSFCTSIVSTSQYRPRTSPDRGTSNRLPANPFFDNIRQNIELSQGIVECIPLRLSPLVASRTQDLPFAWLRDIATTAGKDEGAEALAMQFYRIELGEQQRMQGVMVHHSMQSDPIASSKGGERTANSGKGDPQKVMLFPYSILAGVEKGTKNRYRNIWPFEHSRVRLQQHENDDYINASFVRPLGTRRRYIATQGPLPSTYTDFWSIVWEQNVKVIVMLTRVTEGGNIKCGKYWSDGRYGSYNLKCISVSGVNDEDEKCGGDLFGLSSSSAQPSHKAGCADEYNHTIRRLFELSLAIDPNAKPHIITHLQYLDWSDMDVPSEPKGLLRLMFEVDDLADKANEHGISPVLMHCSAGVGRTGAFIVIDAILDGIRRELRKRIERRKADLAAEDEISTNDSEGQGGSTDAMEVDSGPSREKRVGSSFTAPEVPAEVEKFVTAEPSRKIHPSDITQKEAGPVATLQMTGDISRRLDIHVPLVPSSSSPTQLQTPRPFETKELTNSPTHEQSTQPRLKSTAIMTSSMQATSVARKRPGIYARRVLLSDFTIADADSMFTNSNPNPQFAMDVESMPSGPQQFAGSSSSGEGNWSGKDGASSGSGSAAGSGSSSSDHVKPLQMAFANMSSADDVPGPIGRSSDSDIPQALLSRVQVSSGSGSGSEIGTNTSGSSQNSGRSAAAGGYSSTSSLGLRGFATMGVSSPPSSSSLSSSSLGAIHCARVQPRKKANLLAPKPMHPLAVSVPEMIEGVEKDVADTDTSAARLKADKHLSTSSVRSMLSSSSSSIPSSSSFSSRLVSSHTTDSLATSASVHNISRPASPSADKGKMKELPLGPLASSKDAFNYATPRKIENENSPPLLSTFDEPIRQILENMREQRMSLCQSLRQYVFVHKAVLEGALLIVDQERQRASLEETETPDEDPSFVKMTGKRGASPTELLKEDKKGEVALAKRPSVKRGKSTSSGSGESTGSA